MYKLDHVKIMYSIVKPVWNMKFAIHQLKFRISKG